MEIVLKRILLALTLANLALLAATTNASAKTWKGRWGGIANSTLVFMDGKRVKYCYKAQCVIRPYAGGQKSTVRFTWGPARLSFQWNGSGYNGTHVLRGHTSTILMK